MAEDEILALSSIYPPENFFISERDGIHVGYFITNSIQPHSKLLIGDTSITYLPPLTLNFKLPKGYPEARRPTFRLMCKWMNFAQLNAVCKSLDKIISDSVGDVCLFELFTFLQDDAANSTVDLEAVVRDITVFRNHQRDAKRQEPVAAKKRFKLDRRVQLDELEPDLLRAAVVEHQRKCELAEFDKSSVTCGICFELKYGAACLRFAPCHHVFCADCCGAYFSVKIGDGDTDSLVCMAEKCTSHATPGQVEASVSAELYARYERLQLQKSLDAMADVDYCPRPACRTPVLTEKDERCAQCPLCHFAFCTLCKATYHGVDNCKLTDVKALLDEYEAAGRDGQAALEKKYGRANIRRYVEEARSSLWVGENSKPCPSCRAAIERSEGCNKMQCTKCRAKFCWLCMKILRDDNPYFHYQDPGSGCTGKLFEGTDDADGDDDFVDWDEGDYDEFNDLDFFHSDSDDSAVDFQ